MFMYTLFVDDSGSQDYKTAYTHKFVQDPPLFEGHEQFWRDNYFVLAGVQIHKENLASLNVHIDKIKRKYFGTHKVEIKSDWLRNPYNRQKHYVKPFHIRSKHLDAFGDEIVDFIEKERQRIKIIAVVFDKRFYGKTKRKTPDGNILGKTTQVLLERVHYSKTPHKIYFDQMISSLKLHKGRHGNILHVWKNSFGMKQFYVSNYENILEISFKNSSADNFLQIADLCAYNVYRQFVHYGREWQRPKCENILLYQYFDKIRCNFITLNGRVSGVGLVCIPNLPKHNWDILEGCEKRE